MRDPVIIGDATLYLGDYREVLPTLGKVDAVVTDPPYGIGYTHGGGGKSPWFAGRDQLASNPIFGDDDLFDPSLILGLGVPAIMWGANHFSARLPHGRWLAWNKLGDGIREPWDSFSDVEFAWQNSRAADRIFPLLWKGVARNKTDSYEVASRAKNHPTLKPVALMRWCLGFLPNAETILDPFMGSGTTGVACIAEGRKFIGVEIDPGYFEIACRRIQDAGDRPRLALPAPSPGAQQEVLI